MGEDWIIELGSGFSAAPGIDTGISINLPEHLGLACVVFVMCLRPALDVTQLCIVEWIKRRRKAKIRRRRNREVAAGRTKKAAS